MPLHFKRSAAEPERLKMGKIVKFCSSCDEGFAEKFGFCPNCGQSLQAFEMNPVAEAAPADAPPEPEFLASTETVVETPGAETFEAPSVEVAEVDEVEAIEIEAVEPEIEAAPEVSEEAIEEPIEELPVVEAPKAAAVTQPYFQKTAVDVDRKPAATRIDQGSYASDGEFYITVIEEKNLGQRNALLLGTFSLMVVGLLVGLVANLFIKDLEVGSINDDIFNAVIVDDVPITEEEAPRTNDKDTGGGGGGGGNEDPNPVSKGERAPMRTNPDMPPSVTMDRLTNPTIPVQMAIKGPINENRRFDGPYGYKLGGDTPSDGPGSNGGQGSGRDGGQGPGSGPGYGPGSNGGLGGGNDGGIGPGGGPGSGGGAPPPPPAGVTTKLRIVSKPRPGYTEAARANNVQGTVRLRVTFLGSGQVGGISTVSGLPHGLTEKAIAAARNISFEPEKRNGIGQSVSRVIEYTFAIY